MSAPEAGECLRIGWCCAMPETPRVACPAAVAYRPAHAQYRPPPAMPVVIFLLWFFLAALLSGCGSGDIAAGFGFAVGSADVLDGPGDLLSQDSGGVERPVGVA